MGFGCVIENCSVYVVRRVSWEGETGSGVGRGDLGVAGVAGGRIWGGLCFVCLWRLL